MASRAERKEQARAAREAAEAAAARSAARRTNLLRLGIIAVVAILAVGAGILLFGGGKSNSGGGGGGNLAAETAQVEARFAGIPQHGTVVGDPKAKFTLVEFVDLQCPFCRDYTLNVMPTVLRQFVRPGKIKMDMKVRAFLGPDSLTAAKVAGGAAQQSRLWPFTDVFYSQQGEENSGYVTQDFLKRIAEATPGLNAARALAFAKTQAANDYVNANETLAGALKSTSTPAFFIRRGGGPYEPLNASTASAQDFTQALSQAIGGQ